jgi:hypothetical protein
MAKRVVIFDGRQTAQQVKAFFKTTDAEALEMSTQIINNQFFFVALVDVDPRAFDSYQQKIK